MRGRGRRDRGRRHGDSGGSGTTFVPTGVAYADSDRDGFHSMGEGRGGVSVTVGAKSVQTAAAPQVTGPVGASLFPAPWT
jgi:hypothetical protein